ncbi:MAG: DNA repair exonuclease [Nanoarchaeota archaeon]
MKFAHLADCHLGGWRDPKLRLANLEAFCRAVDECVEAQVDFVIIAGDLFNTSLPALDILKSAVTKLRLLADKGIPVYCVPGSHDFSPSGKSMLEILEEAGLLINVVKGDVVEGKLRLRFTVDKKTGAKLTGMLGRRGSLEKGYFESMDTQSLEQEQGFKIFVFHSAVEELKPQGLDKLSAMPLSLLPKGFSYYAGGHVHAPSQTTLEGYGLIAFPGPLFPNSFSELEELERGQFLINEDSNVKARQIQLYNVTILNADAEHKAPEQVTADLMAQTEGKEFAQCIVLIRVRGVLGQGKPSDIAFTEIFAELYRKSAFVVLKNTASLSSKEFEDVRVQESTVAELEDRLVREHEGQMQGKVSILVKELMQVLDLEKAEDERRKDFEQRLVKAASPVLEAKGI